MKRDILTRITTGVPVITDGAMGTLLQSRMPGYHGSFELLNIDQPGIVEDIHRLYTDAGAELILTNSFGANAAKLAEYGLADRCREINRAAATVARKAAGENVFVAGDISATGHLVAPMGETPVDLVYDAYREQVIGLTEGGADLLVIETMSDLQETLIALRAAKENSSLPVLCSMTFEENGATISGTEIVAGLATLAAHGADIVGANCSLGPVQLHSLFESRMKELEKIGVPLSIWSNAGLPRLIDGKTVFPLGPDEFSTHAARFASLGFSIIGGCCGTTPDHIRALAGKIANERCSRTEFSKRHRFITSRYGFIDTESHQGLLKIGERLNPSARKAFAADLKEGRTAFLFDESRAQVEEGADVLDINVGVPGIDEISAIRDCVKILANSIRIPLMIDSDNAAVLEEALKLYPGCAIVNSINGKDKSLKSVLPVIKRYGCFIVVLCLDESGIHREAEKRAAIGDRLISLLESEGIHRDRIIIDPLMLAESAEPGSAAETLKVIRHFADRGIKTSLGISNVSFGLPQRKYVNNAFLKLALDEGLTAGIINTKALRIIDTFTEEETLARNFLLGKDPNAGKYISHFASVIESKKESTTAEVSPLDRIRSMVVNGDMDNIAQVTRDALANIGPEDIMNNGLISGLETVGEYYSRGVYFLPQMIASANAMKNGFAVLKPVLAQESSSRAGKVVICTVRGDIHDIGKNIVAMMLENHGFDVIDLGKDVPNEDVVALAEKEGADIIALSSLLTTTMGEMATIRKMIDEKKLKAKLMVGGAVVTEEYAKSIGAHYSKDAVAAANLAKKLNGAK